VSTISLCLNFVYADIYGNIGYRMSGLLPIRSQDNRTLPIDGSTTEHEWQGFVPQQQMPTLFNPPSHMIVTANNRIVPNNYPVYVATDWDSGYRAQRITNLLAAMPRLSIADYERMQSDVYSIPASILTPYFIAAGQGTHDSDTSLAVKLLKQWNYTLSRNSVGATIYEMTASALFYKMLKPLLGRHLYTTYQTNYTDSGFFTFLINIVRSPMHPFFNTAAGGTASAQRDALIVSALQDTIKHLQAHYGLDPTQWYWGKIHRAHFVHPLSNVFPLNLLFGKTQLERPGDDETINIGGDDNFNANPAHYYQLTVSSMREIIDLSNFDNSLWIITTGESGQPFSDHYNDLNPLWDQNQYQTMAFSSQQIPKIIKAWLVLNP
jgi:penicillin amidase